MLVRLDHSFYELSTEELRNHYGILQNLLHFHVDKRILLCLSPRMINLLTSDPQVGVGNIKMLEIVSKRALEYNAILKRGLRFTTIFPEGKAIIPLMSADRLEGYGNELISFLSHFPRFYVENSSNDGQFYRLMFARVAKFIDMNPDLAFSTLFHGGGDTLGNVVYNLKERFLIGMSICDRDSNEVAPPFKNKSTGDGMLDCCIKMNAATDHENYTHPFFRIFSTQGWALENYVGPNLLDLFFTENPESALDRQKFIAAFPRFPSLNGTESSEWLLINMKKSDQAEDSLVVGQARYQLGGDEGRRRTLANLKMPSSAVKWVIENDLDSRYSKRINAAILKDLETDSYRNDIFGLAREYFCIFAADSRMKFS